MSSQAALRYIGLDLGTTNSVICHTYYDAQREQFAEPEAPRFGSKHTLRSLLLLDDMGRDVVAYGEEIYQRSECVLHPQRVREEFKLRLGQDPEALWCTQQIATRLLDAQMRVLQLGAPLAASAFRTALGVPADWEQSPERILAVVQAVQEAGFPEVVPVAEPVGAMYYHAFRGDICFEDRPQLWLVVDFGGGTLDLAFVETASGGRMPHVLSTHGETYGGKDFDQLLLEKLLLAHHWQGPSPDPSRQMELLILARQFKERFSNEIAQGRDSYEMSRRIAGLVNPIALSRREFESESLAGPLIDRFSMILDRGMREVERPYSDVEGVILTGGSARWYFVRDTIERMFHGQTVVISIQPEQTIAKGLALALTGFQLPQHERNEQEEPEPEDSLGEITSTANVEIIPEGESAGMTDPALEVFLARCHHRAQQVIHKYAVGGFGLALLVSPLPGVSQPFLTAMEAKLVHDVARIYGINLKGEQLAAVVAGILGAGTLLKIGVMEAATLVPGVGWVIKSSVAGGAIEGLGQGTMAWCENQRRRSWVSPTNLLPSQSEA